MKYLIANWKMNSIDIEEWFKGFNKFFREIKNDVEVIVCPSYVDIVKCSQQAPNLIMAAQDVSIHDDGPFTGQISALQLSRTSEQLKYCLLGHSEVRSKGDTNSLIRIKSKKLEAYKINSILCVGEDENVLNEEDNIEKRFSFYYDFPGNLQVFDVKGAALEEIFERITQDILNETLAKW